jgi:hypothetical protein
MTPVELAREREQRLIQGLRDLASRHNITLVEPLSINSNGEMYIVVIHPDHENYRFGCGRYGTLALILNRYSPRIGIFPTKRLQPGDGWCYMNHFDVEKMLTDEGLYQTPA